MRTIERYVPTVEDALGRLAWARWMTLVFPNDAESHRVVEALSVQLDMANALASEERLRASVAW